MQQSISLSNGGRPSTPNLAGHANQEISSPLIGVSRPLSIDDVRVFQNAFARHDTEQEQSGLQATFNDFYAVCVGPKAPNQMLEQEKTSIPTAEFNTTALGLFNSWFQHLRTHIEDFTRMYPGSRDHLKSLTREDEPKTIEQMYALYQKYKDLNTISPVQYQSGVPEEGVVPTGNFVHFKLHRFDVTGKSHQPEFVRLYVNVTAAKIPTVVQELVDAARTQQIPLHLKYTDLTIHPKHLLDESLRRSDRIVVYTDPQTATKFLDSVRAIQARHPGAFMAQSTPLLTAEIMPGVGIGEEPTAEQHRLSGELCGKAETSFSGIRYPLIEKAFISATEVLMSKNRDYTLRNGRTIKNVFDEELTLEVAEQNKGRRDLRAKGGRIEDYPDVDARQIIDAAWSARLNPDRTNEQFGQGVKAARLVKKALEKCMYKVLPDIAAKDVHRYVEREIQRLAPQFQVDPTNLARNLV